MKRACLGLLLACLMALPLMVVPGAAQSVPRVKGRIVSFDGLTFQFAPDGGGAQMAVRLQPRTQFMESQPRTLQVVTVGTYVSVRVTAQSAALAAEDVQLYPATLRGAGEGRLLTGGDTAVISGVVTAASTGRLTVFYRGSQMAGGACIGRAEPARPSPVCTGDAVIQVPANVTVRALVPADRRLLVAGAIATVSLETDAKGVRSTPGLILEKP
jgi:hypothetical protein